MKRGKLVLLTVSSSDSGKNVVVNSTFDIISTISSNRRLIISSYSVRVRYITPAKLIISETLMHALKFFLSILIIVSTPSLKSYK